MISLLLISAALAQSPHAPAGDALPPEEVARLESKHLANIRQVTTGFARAGEGYFSPDGQSIIFQAVPHVPPGVFRTPTANEDAYQIYLADLAADAPARLVSTGKGKCTCAYFHPTDGSILFASSHLDPNVDEVQAPRGPAYSRSERYAWEFPEHMDIFRADRDGQNLVRLTDAPGYDAEASYSPDGSRIVFTSFRDGDADIYIMDADGSNVKQITDAPGYDGGPFFSPDGTRIIYRSDRQDNDLLQLFVNNLEGTAERQLTDDENVNWGPYWHPDNRHIIYATSKHGHRNYELYLMDVDSGGTERITYAEGFDGLPVFSPDGSKLMWTSSGRTADAKSQLFIADFTLEPQPGTESATVGSR